MTRCKMGKLFQFSLLCLLFVMLGACHNSYPINYYQIMLSPELVPCKGWMGMTEQCMKIKYLDSKNQTEPKWEFLFNVIKGFAPQKGYIYKLYVKDRDFSKEPVFTDHFGQYFTLVKIIDQQKIDTKL